MPHLRPCTSDGFLLFSLCGGFASTPTAHLTEHTFTVSHERPSVAEPIRRPSQPDVAALTCLWLDVYPDYVVFYLKLGAGTFPLNKAP